jgi:hypothetical protein
LLGSIEVHPLGYGSGLPAVFGGWQVDGDLIARMRITDITADNFVIFVDNVTTEGALGGGGTIQLVCRPVDPVPGYFGAYAPLIARHCYFLTTSSTGEQHTYGAYSVPAVGGNLTPLKDADLAQGKPREPGGCTGPVLGSDCITIPILHTQTFEEIVQGLENAVAAGPQATYNTITNNCNTWAQHEINSLELAVTLPDHTIASQVDLCREIINGYLTGVLKSYGVRFGDQVLAFYYGLFTCAF